ncbi:MAG: methylated-DNA--[protein]-cysteine S-methyltransferase [Dehalococcoidales bacterium]|nr:methylated-DNA--[protein]-cysteine S-methyltransferase [Dehalococcoidales bacterium]
MINYCVFYLKEGWIGLAGTSEGLLKITLPQKSREYAEASITKQFNCTESSETGFENAVIQLTEYFSGSRYSFSLALDFSATSQFTRSVLEAVREIPYGEVRTYTEIACIIGNPKSSRAVGQALKCNPFPIVIPCHRVIASRGELGGFSGGLELKRYLLEMEKKFKPDV